MTRAPAIGVRDFRTVTRIRASPPGHAIKGETRQVAGVGSASGAREGTNTVSNAAGAAKEVHFMWAPWRWLSAPPCPVRCHRQLGPARGAPSNGCRAPGTGGSLLLEGLPGQGVRNIFLGEPGAARGE